MLRCSVCSRYYGDWGHYEKRPCKCGAGMIESEEDYKQETKMTRQDAIKKINDICGPDFTSAKKAIAVYEALGLIKFEEEEKKTICGIPLEVIIDVLTKNGYHLVKKDECVTVTIESAVETYHSGIGRKFNGKLLKIEQ